MEQKALTGYPSIDKPWLKYYSEEAINAPLPECTVYENIKNNNIESPNDIALQYFSNKITYKTLFANVEKVKNALVANGVKKGDKIIMFTSSTPELIYVVLALGRIGAIANMINPVFSLEQIKDRINETDAEIMLVLDQLFAKIFPALDELCIRKIVVIDVCNEMPKRMKLLASIKMKKKIPYGKEIVRWKDFIVEGRNASSIEDIPYEKDIPLVMVYSSGTTGASKGIVLSNDGINATISHYLSPDFPYTRGDKFLQLIPVWFSTGVVLSLLMPICLGITVVLEPIFSKENFAKGIKKIHPQMTLAPISLWLYAIGSKELKKINLSNMTYPFTGGELVIPRVEKQVNQFLKKNGCNSVLMKGYGMCELGSTVATDSLLKQKSGATGFPMKGVTVAVFNVEKNEEMRYGERGEILVDSPAHMKEYYKNEEATKAFFYKDAKGTLWGRTGDIGYITEDGFITILGRANDTFKAKSGEILFCFDIENEIIKDRNVALCEVVGIPGTDSDVPVAHIVLEEDCNLSEQDVVISVHNACVSRLNEQCVPCGYKIRKEFPVKSSGKRDMELIKQDREGFLIPTEDGVKSISF